MSSRILVKSFTCSLQALIVWMYVAPSALGCTPDMAVGWYLWVTPPSLSYEDYGIHGNNSIVCYLYIALNGAVHSTACVPSPNYTVDTVPSGNLTIDENCRVTGTLTYRIRSSMLYTFNVNEVLFRSGDGSRLTGYAHALVNGLDQAFISNELVLVRPPLY